MTDNRKLKKLAREHMQISGHGYKRSLNAVRTMQMNDTTFTLEKLVNSDILKKVDSLSHSTGLVLILGTTGVGKTLLQQSICERLANNHTIVNIHSWNVPERKFTSNPNIVHIDAPQYRPTQEQINSMFTQGLASNPDIVAYDEYNNHDHFNLTDEKIIYPFATANKNLSIVTSYASLHSVEPFVHNFVASTLRDETMLAGVDFDSVLKLVLRVDANKDTLERVIIDHTDDFIQQWKQHHVKMKDSTVWKNRMKNSTRWNDKIGEPV